MAPTVLSEWLAGRSAPLSVDVVRTLYLLVSLSCQIYAVSCSTSCVTMLACYTDILCSRLYQAVVHRKAVVAHKLLHVMQVTETSQTASFKRPRKLIEIYEFEGCPFCRKVNVMCNFVVVLT